jgi:hypothetical protein
MSIMQDDLHPLTSPRPCFDLSHPCFSWLAHFYFTESDGQRLSAKQIQSRWTSQPSLADSFIQPLGLAGFIYSTRTLLRRMRSSDTELILGFFPLDPQRDVFGEALERIKPLMEMAGERKSDAMSSQGMLCAHWACPSQGISAVACLRASDQHKKQYLPNAIFNVFEDMGRLCALRLHGPSSELCVLAAASLASAWSAERKHPGYHEPNMAMALLEFAPRLDMDALHVHMAQSHSGLTPEMREEFAAFMRVPLEKRDLMESIKTVKPDRARARL